MKKFSYILGLIIAVSVASCTKVAPVRTIEEAKAESVTFEKSAITIVPDSDSNAGITDPENDEDHDKENHNIK